MSPTQRSVCATTCCHVYHSFLPRLPDEEGYSTTTCHMAPDPASLLGRATALTCVSWLQTHLPAEESSDAAMCLTVLDPTSLLSRAQVLSHVPHLRTRASLLRRALALPHVPGLQTHIPAQEGSGAATCPTAF
jgi:hypothetical protein